jgi:predicted PurR-regulated permease PerM
MENKDVAVMNDHELLQELVVIQRRNNLMKMVAYTMAICFLAAFIIAIVIVVPRLMASLDELTVTMNNINDLSAEVSRSLKNADSALQNIDAIDFESLNKAIKDFAAVIQPLANLFGH